MIGALMLSPTDAQEPIAMPPGTSRKQTAGATLLLKILEPLLAAYVPSVSSVSGACALVQTRATRESGAMSRITKLILVSPYPSRP